MSRWILQGLRSGIRTTRFPSPTPPYEEGASSTVRLQWQRLSAPDALAAAQMCPSGAIQAQGTEVEGELTYDAGRCIMCGRCARHLPQVFLPVKDGRVAVRQRSSLVTRVGWSAANRPLPLELGRAAEEVRQRAVRIFRHSLHIRHVDAGSCNGCESELQMLTGPYADLHRLGIFFTPTPRHADVLLVTGVVTVNMERPLMETYAAMPEPKLVIAAGVCAVSGGSFAGGPVTRGPVDRLLPVDVHIPGCPPTPQAMLHGLLLAMNRAEDRPGPEPEEVADGA